MQNEEKNIQKVFRNHEEVNLRRLSPDMMSQFTSVLIVAPLRLLHSSQTSLASYADILWVRHAIFLPYERLLKRMVNFRARSCKKQSGVYLRGLPSGLRDFQNRRFESFSVRSYRIFCEEKGGRCKGQFPIPSASIGKIYSSSLTFIRITLQ